jgi:hypothetical protein
MSQHFLTTREAAKRLGFAVSTLYSWLAQSDSGTFYLQGEQITIEYSQTGAKGQGHIRIAAQEVDRLMEAMKAAPRPPRQRRPPRAQVKFPGITVPLGRPDD